MKRIRNNDLTHYFLRDHATLPASYVKSCQEFFKWLDESNKEGFKAPSSKRQASSDKLQAASRKQQATSCRMYKQQNKYKY